MGKQSNSGGMVWQRTSLRAAFHQPISGWGEFVTSTTPSVEQAYRQSISGFSRLTPAEERELSSRIQKGDEAARKKMIECSLYLVLAIADEYSDCGVPFMDLVQEGNLGLMEAAKRYEGERGNRFSTYAKWWIKQSIRKFLHKMSKQVRLPAYVANRLYKLRMAHNSLSSFLCRPPSVAELAEATGFSVDKVEKYLSLSLTPLRLDELVEAEDGGVMPCGFSEDPALMDESGCSPSDILDGRLRSEMLLEMLEFLDARDSQILTMRYGLDGGECLTQERVGLHFKITRQRVEQLENRALRHLKVWINNRMKYGPGVTMSQSGRLVSVKSGGRCSDVVPVVGRGSQRIGKPCVTALGRAA